MLIVKRESSHRPGRLVFDAPGQPGHAGRRIRGLSPRTPGSRAHTFGVSTLQVALAYVLCQPRINTFALIGSLPPNKIDTSVRALEVALSSAELAWLDLEADTPPL